MLDGFIIQSHMGPYSVRFVPGLLEDQSALLAGTTHFLVDSNVARLYSEPLRAILGRDNSILIDATEENKSVERVIPVIELLVNNRIRRDHMLVAVGGGIVQDITCFIASTLLRGLGWRFAPTTLLAQADSCIGSKSSINLGATKNILGTFNPPREIFVCSRFLETLERKDILSGVGEILKVHAIDGPASYDRAVAEYDRILADRSVLMSYIREALRIKQRYIEADEFDRGVRNVFNYGHSFGHAIESVTKFAIPHGIAVTMGMDIANHIAAQRGLLPETHYGRMHRALRRNYADYAATEISEGPMVEALLKDKKNTSNQLVLIFPTGDNAAIERVPVAADDAFRAQCRVALAELRK